MACDLVRKIANQIKEQICYGLIADETADISQVEQLSICFRTVDDELNPDEKVIGFSLDRCDGKSIFEAIKDVLLRLDINLQKCFGMTFDGASSFSSNKVGVGARIQEIATSAIRTHCHMHCVNLAVQDVVKNVSFMRNFLHFSNDLIVFLRNSPKRCTIIRNIAIQLENSQTHIRPLCPTRFTMKYHALNGVYKQLDVIIESLSIIEMESNDNNAKSTASGFLRRLGDFDSYFALLLSLQIFELTDRLSKELQGKEIPVGKGIELVSYAIKELELMHSEERFNNLWTEVDTIRLQHGADPARLFRQIKPPIRFEIIQTRNYNEPRDYYIEKYYEIIDLACERLRNRITDKSLPLLKAIESLITSAWKGHQVDKKLIQIVCNHYGEDNIDSRRLEAQLISLENLNTHTGITSLTEIIKFIGKNEIQVMIPMVIKLIKYYLVCPASTANAERSFSHLRRLKTYLRSTMRQTRLNSLLILSTYKEELDNIDVKKALKEFISRKEERQRVFICQ